MPALITLLTQDGTELAVRVVHSLTIGRGPASTLRAGDRNVSRQHAIISRLDDGSYELRDGGSSYGTWVNGEPVAQCRLSHNDAIYIGDLELRFYLVPPIPSDDFEPGTVVIEAAGAAAAGGGGDGEELQAARSRIEALLDQVDDLRRQVKDAQFEEDQARKECDGVGEELREARAELGRLRAAHEALEAQAARLAEESRAAKPQQSAAPDVGPLERRLWESTRQVEALQAQIAQLNARDAQLADPRKEAARLSEELERTRGRLAATTEALQAAMARISALGEEIIRIRAQQ